MDKQRNERNQNTNIDNKDFEAIYKNRERNLLARVNAQLKKKRRKRKLIRFSIVFVVLAAVYLTAIYSSIPVIAKWRSIYIETAMSTNSHQWLATYFIPRSVIDKVMAQRQANLDSQEGLESTWGITNGTNALAGTDNGNFYKIYWEIDNDAFRNYLEANPELTKNGYDSILIEDLEGTLGLKTVNNDSLLILDTANHVMIIGVSGEGYKGKMAIVKDPSQIDLVKSSRLEISGEIIDNYGERYDAVIAINASGFEDVEGHGSGGSVKGALIIDGIDYGHHETAKSHWKLFGFQYDNRLYITDYSSAIVSDYRWAVEFSPALIIDGERVVEGTAGWGIQPRATIGQAQNGDFMMLIVDGRQVGYSIGCTVTDCADIMLRYGAYQGVNLDGGSSAIMWYNGQQITSSSSPSGYGRYLPDAIIVQKAEATE